jgi:hypothetical protein
MKDQNPELLRSASQFDQSSGPMEEQGLRINGMQQVIDLLRHADPAFRESLLKRLGQRDPQLVQNLKKIIR